MHFRIYRSFAWEVYSSTMLVMYTSMVRSLIFMSSVQLYLISGWFNNSAS